MVDKTDQSIQKNQGNRDESRENTLRCFGDAHRGLSEVPELLQSGIDAIYSGRNHNCALKVNAKL